MSGEACPIEKQLELARGTFRLSMQTSRTQLLRPAVRLHRCVIAVFCIAGWHQLASAAFNLCLNF